MKYLYIIEKGTNNYSVYVPDLLGCAAAGKTKSETERLTKEAILFHIEGMLEEGGRPPEPSASFTGFAQVKPPIRRERKMKVQRTGKVSV